MYRVVKVTVCMILPFRLYAPRVPMARPKVKYLTYLTSDGYLGAAWRKRSEPHILYSRSTHHQYHVFIAVLIHDKGFHI